MGLTETDITPSLRAILPNAQQKTDQNEEETHQFHAKLMRFVLGMRARRQSEATPPVWGELLLLQLGVQATRECHLQIYTHV